MAKLSQLNKPSAFKALATSLSSAHHRDASGSTRVPDRTLARATRDRPWTQPPPRVDKSAALSVKLSRHDGDGHSPPSRLPISRPATLVNIPVAGQKAKSPVKTMDTLIVAKTRKPAPAGGKDATVKSIVNKVDRLTVSKTRKSAPAGKRDEMVKSPVHKKATPAKVRPTVALVKSSPTKRTRARVGPSVPPKSVKREVPTPAIVKSTAGARGPPVAARPSVSSLVASGLMKRIIDESDKVGDLTLISYELCPGYYGKASKDNRYIPTSVTPLSQPADDTCLPCWSKFDGCFRNANPLPSAHPSAFFKRKLAPSAELEPPLQSSLRPSSSWKRLELNGYTRPKKSVTFGGEEVREYESGFGNWKPIHIGQAQYRSAENGKTIRDKAMFDHNDGTQTLDAIFVKRFQSVHRYLTKAMLQPAPSSDESQLELVQRLRLSERLLRQFEENDGKLTQELSFRDPLYLSDYWNLVSPKPQPKPLPVPVQSVYGNGTFFLDVISPLPRTITEVDILMQFGEHMLGHMFQAGELWIDISISEP